MYIYCIWYSLFPDHTKISPKKEQETGFSKVTKKYAPHTHMYDIFIFIFPPPTKISPKKNMLQQKMIPPFSCTFQKKHTTKQKKTPQIRISEQLGICLTTLTLSSHKIYHVRQKLWHLSTSKVRSCSSDNSDFKLTRSWESEWIPWTWWMDLELFFVEIWNYQGNMEKWTYPKWKVGV